MLLRLLLLHMLLLLMILLLILLILPRADIVRMLVLHGVRNLQNGNYTDETTTQRRELACGLEGYVTW